MLTVKEMITQLVVCYLYFKGNYKIFAIDLGKQQALDADPTSIQQINFTANADLGPFTRNCKSNVNVLYNNLIYLI